MIISDKLNMSHQQICFATRKTNCTLPYISWSVPLRSGEIITLLYLSLETDCPVWGSIQSSIRLDNAEWKATTMIKAVFVRSQAEKAIGQDHSAVFSYLMKLTEKTKLDSS